MYNLQNLEISHILPTANGIFVFAKYPGWWSKFSFFIEESGRVTGKTHEGSWAELGREISESIKAKVQSTLIEKSSLVYA